MDDAGNQSKRLNGTVISMEDEDKQVKCQHDTVLPMDDGVNQSKRLHGTVISIKDEEKQVKC